VRLTTRLLLPRRLAKARGSFDRARPQEYAASLLPMIRARFGITRVADTTRLDRIGIPTVTAIVPSTADDLSVYGGKGLDKEQATLSAVFEAAERQVCATYSGPTYECSPDTIDDLLGLDNLGVVPAARTKPMLCVEGHDLVNGRVVPVPLGIVKCPWRHAAVSEIVSTNGLASGTSVAEAFYHALFEVVERHLYSLTHIHAHVWPKFLFERAHAYGLTFADVSSDDPIATEIMLPTNDSLVDTLLERIQQAGLEVRLLALTDAKLPLTVCATIYERGENWGFSGFGCSWSPRHASVRAVTEAVQSRNVEIQGSREDLIRPDEVTDAVTQRAQSPERDHRGRWFFDGPASCVSSFRDLVDCSSADLMVELHALIAALASVGYRSVVMVDLTPADSPVSVVRAIVPGLETHVIDQRFGSRTRRAFLG